MLSTISRKRIQLLALISVLAVLLVVSTAFAAGKLIIAKKGGTIDVAEGIQLKILPNALEEDTVITADLVRKKHYVCFNFGPDGTTFAGNKPAQLRAAWETVGDAEDLILYGEHGEEIQAKISKQGVIWKIPHFSLYYYRTR